MQTDQECENIHLHVLSVSFRLVSCSISCCLADFSHSLSFNSTSPGSSKNNMRVNICGFNSVFIKGINSYPVSNLYFSSMLRLTVQLKFYPEIFR